MAKLLLKMLLAGCIVFFMLNVITYYYYSPPQKVLNAVQTTDFILEKNYTGYIMDEGMAKFSTDENGYNNDLSVDKNNIDILIMGSSHTLAYNVNRDENYASILHEKLKNDSELNDCSEVYNIGMWGHIWYALANDFNNAYRTYHPSKYVIMEIHDYLGFSIESLDEIINNEYPREGFANSKLLDTLRLFPYIQLAMHQMNNILIQNRSEGKTSKTSVVELNENDYKEYEKKLDEIIVNINKLLQDSHCKLILLYQPHLVLNKDGTANVVKLKDDYVSVFKDVCSRNNVIFCDMSIEFINYYNKNHQLPHGFLNTAVGEGHLNKYGHRIIGEELYRIIKEDQKAEVAVK